MANYLEATGDYTVTGEDDPKPEAVMPWAWMATCCAVVFVALMYSAAVSDIARAGKCGNPFYIEVCR